MFIVNGIANANERTDNIEVTSVKPLDDMMMIVTFISILILDFKILQL